MQHQIRPELLAVLLDDLAIEPELVVPGASLVEDLGIDSLSAMITVVALEERMGVQLTGDALVECRTVADLETLIDGVLPRPVANP
ncbi:MAG: phosphopantetheine-binding protein [Actinobacteria bacterium]|nr:phosphopantetheine-binding protein [Actinomycetota bacterium]